MSSLQGTQAKLTSQRLALFARCLRLIVRALAVIACLEFSGALAYAADIVAAPDPAAEDCCLDCPLEQSGRECPPMCPACQCTHALLAIPARTPAALVTCSAPSTAVDAPFERSLAPPMPWLDGLYRPPRSATRPRLAR